MPRPFTNGLISPVSPKIASILEDSPEAIDVLEPVTIKTARPGLEITGRVRRPPPKIRVDINKLLKPVGIKDIAIAPVAPGVINVNEMLRRVVG